MKKIKMSILAVALLASSLSAEYVRKLSFDEDIAKKIFESAERNGITFEQYVEASVILNLKFEAFLSQFDYVHVGEIFKSFRNDPINDPIDAENKKEF